MPGDARASSGRAGRHALDEDQKDYDASETHRRIVATLLSEAGLQPGMRVLDIATGTGAVALKAAEIVGPHGSVVGINLSDGMLAEARRKLSAARPSCLAISPGSSPDKRAAIRAAYIAKITNLAVNNRVPDVVAQNFVYGRKL